MHGRKGLKQRLKCGGGLDYLDSIWQEGELRSGLVRAVLFKKYSINCASNEVNLMLTFKRLLIKMRKLTLL